MDQKILQVCKETENKLHREFGRTVSVLKGSVLDDTTSAIQDSDEIYKLLYRKVDKKDFDDLIQKKSSKKATQ